MLSVGGGQEKRTNEGAAALPRDTKKREVSRVLMYITYTTGKGGGLND